MTSYTLPKNYTDNVEALLRKSRSCTASSSATPLAVEPVAPAPFATSPMAKSLHAYSTPDVTNVLIGPVVNTGTENFKL